MHDNPGKLFQAFSGWLSSLKMPGIMLYGSKFVILNFLFVKNINFPGYLYYPYQYSDIQSFVRQDNLKICILP